MWAWRMCTACEWMAAPPPMTCSCSCRQISCRWGFASHGIIRQQAVQAPMHQAQTCGRWQILMHACTAAANSLPAHQLASVLVLESITITTLPWTLLIFATMTSSATPIQPAHFDRVWSVVLKAFAHCIPSLRGISKLSISQLAHGHAPHAHAFARDTLQAGKAGYA